MGKQIWKLFVPKGLLTSQDSYIYGHLTCENQSAYITASSPISAECFPTGMNFIGVWRKQINNLTFNYAGKVLLLISKNESSDLHCVIFVNGAQLTPTFIVVNPFILLKSVVIGEKSNKLDLPLDNISSVVKILNHSRQSMNPVKMHDSLHVFCWSGSQQKHVTAMLPLWLVVTISWLYKPVMLIKAAVRQPDEPGTSHFYGVPAVVGQLNKRAACLQPLSHTLQQLPVTNLNSINKCVTQIVDSLLGILLMWYLINKNNSFLVADACLSYGDVVAQELKILLQWLIGAPAGLKLNSQLTQYLASFFKYHIYLWTGYLYLLKPALGLVVQYSSVVGVLGLTVQLALFQDIFATLTLHIYCFYVYAARLYRLQIYTLSSLWRLFRGKKWNDLRMRVDSAMYDAGELLVGTLLFTILVFLLPTTGLYYIVFTLLRMVIVTIQGIVSKIRDVINNFPSWTLCLWLVNSAALADAAPVDIVRQNKDQEAALTLTLQSQRLSLSEAISLTRENMATSGTLSWGTFATNLLKGHLTYPWIDGK